MWGLLGNTAASMPTVLSISSQVAYGHVGHSASVFAWQRLGIEVIALPTIVLSNRPDYPHAAGVKIDLSRLDAMLHSLEANGQLDAVDALFTGYMPTAAHAECVARWAHRLKAPRPDLLVMCDPILGDEPGGLYIPEAAAEAVRDVLLPRADIAKPNCFELGWLTRTKHASLEGIAEAARALAATVLVTSCPQPQGKLSNVLNVQGGAWRSEVVRRDTVPHGTGDLIAALFLAHILRSRPATEALALATAGVETVVEASLGAPELRLIESQDFWTAPAPWPLQRLETAT